MQQCSMWGLALLALGLRTAAFKSRLARLGLAWNGSVRFGWIVLAYRVQTFGNQNFHVEFRVWQNLPLWFRVWQTNISI